MYRKLSNLFITIRVFAVGTLCIALAACTSSPPKHTENICDIFDEKRGWYDDAKKAEKRWGSSIPTMMAIMYQESGFVAKARPKRKKFLWIFPGARPSDAYGYAQVKDDTWKWYKKSSGRSGADRHDFDDAIDFVGWYNKQSQKLSNINLSNTYGLYLAYHEGHGGFNRKTYASKDWLKATARKVADRASRYTTQLQRCEKRLSSKGWWIF